MRKYIGIFMSVLIIMLLIFVAPAQVIAEDNANINVMTVDFYSDDGAYYGTYEVPYTITIYEDGRVVLRTDTLILPISGKFITSNLTITSNKNIVYEQNTNILSPNRGFALNEKGEDVWIYDFSNTWNSNFFTTDLEGKAYFFKDGVREYFTDTIIVEFNGITIVKEIGKTDLFQDISEDSVFGDIDGDGLVNAIDASLILSYSTYQGVGGSLSFREWLSTI